MGRGRRGPTSRWLATVLCALGSLCAAAPAAADMPLEWRGQPIEEIEILGEARARVSPRDIGVPLGVPLTRTLIRRTVLRLAETGLYRNVQIDAERSGRGVTLLVRLTPRFVAQRIDIVGNEQLSGSEILRALELREEGEVVRESLPEKALAVEKRYVDIGYRAAQVDIEMRDTDDPIRKVVRVEVDEGSPTLIDRYVFVGDRLPKRKGLRRPLKLNEGEPLHLEELQQTLDTLARRLREAGYYETVFGEPEVSVRGRRATVRVPSHVGPHYAIAIAGQAPLSRGEVLDELRLAEEPLSPQGPFGTIEGRVVELYRKLGFNEARVILSTSPPGSADCEERDDPGRARALEPVDPPQTEAIACGQAVLRVRVEPGAQLEVKGVRFVGAHHFEQDFLREQLYSYLEEDLPGSAISQPVDPHVADSLGFGGSKQPGPRDIPPPPITDPRRLYYAPTYEEALDHIRDLYRGDGYLSVDISDVELRPTGSEHEAEAIFAIDEGPRTFVHDVQVSGNVQMTSYDLLDAVDLARAQPFSYLALEEARLRAVDAYRERGFLYATVAPLVRFSQDGTRADINFEVVERFAVRVGGIEVRGAERSRESMIRNRVALQPGDLYRPSEARLSEEQILSLDAFTSANVAPEEADLPARIKTVVVTVTERRSQWLGWSGGFSTGQGARGGIEYGYRNLFGSAVQTTLRGQLGYQFVFLDDEIRQNYATLGPDERIEYQVNAGISMPYIPNAPRIGTSLDFVLMQDLQRDYRLQKEGMIASLYYRPVKRVVLTFAEELEQSFFELFQAGENPANLPVTELVPFGENTLVSTHISAAWDLRDRAFNPRKGALFSVTSQWAKTLRDSEQEVRDAEGNPTTVRFQSNMLRFTATGAFYVPLLPKLVFATQIRWGRVVHLEPDSQAYPNRLFYLGGINFRGFRQYAMVPQDLEDNPDFDASQIVSRGGETFIVAQNELRFPLFGQLYGGVFGDVGNLWSDPRGLNVPDLEVTVGVGIRLQTPVASLAFDYGVRQVDVGPFELKGAFQFAFQRF